MAIGRKIKRGWSQFGDSYEKHGTRS